jgi:hypothetical protein
LPFPKSPDEPGASPIIVQIGNERFAIHWEIEDLPPAASLLLRKRAAKGPRQKTAKQSLWLTPSRSCTSDLRFRKQRAMNVDERSGRTSHGVGSEILSPSLRRWRGLAVRRLTRLPAWWMGQTQAVPNRRLTSEIER